MSVERAGNKSNTAFVGNAAGQGASAPAQPRAALSADDMALENHGVKARGLAGIVEFAEKQAATLREPRYSSSDTGWLADRIESSIAGADEATLKRDIEPALAALKTRGATQFSTMAGWLIGPSSKRAILSSAVQQLETRVKERHAALERVKSATQSLRTGPQTALRAEAISAATNAAIQHSQKWLPEDAGRVFGAALQLVEQDPAVNRLDEVRDAAALLRAHATNVEFSGRWLFSSTERMTADKAAKLLETKLAERLARPGALSDRQVEQKKAWGR